MEKLNVSNKTILLVLTIILILLIIINYLINNLRDNKYIYEDISVTKLMYQGEEITDRTIYYTLENIIVKYISSYYGTTSTGVEIELEEEPEYNYQEYYEALENSYKKHLGKKEYLELSEKFLNKFYVESGDQDIEVHYYMDTYNIIKGIYRIKENTYICELYSSSNYEYGYIGIVLDPPSQEYRIFIIE